MAEKNPQKVLFPGFVAISTKCVFGSEPASDNDAVLAGVFVSKPKASGPPGRGPKQHRPIKIVNDETVSASSSAAAATTKAPPKRKASASEGVAPQTASKKSKAAASEGVAPRTAPKRKAPASEMGGSQITKKRKIVLSDSDYSE